MNQELKRLISLQEIDDQIYEIESLAGDLPNKVKNKEALANPDILNEFKNLK